MKKFLSVLFFCLIYISSLAFAEVTAESDYFANNRIGELVDRIRDGNKITDLRFMEVKHVKTGTNLLLNNTLYDDFDSKKVVGEIDYKKDKFIDVSKICNIFYVSGYDKGEVYENVEFWIEVSTESKKGWLLYGTGTYFYDLLVKDKNYKPQEIIIDGDRKWKVRKMVQPLIISKDIKVQNIPGSNGKKIGTVKARQEAYTTLGITEQTDTVDGISDHWIELENGWIFGGDLDEHDTKYKIPEEWIKYFLGDKNK